MESTIIEKYISQVILKAIMEMVIRKHSECESAFENNHISYGQ